MQYPAEDSGSTRANRRRLASLERLIHFGAALVVVAAICLLVTPSRALDVVILIGSAALLIGAFGLVQSLKRMQSELTLLSTRLNAIEQRISAPAAPASHMGAEATAPALDLDSLRAQLEAARSANDAERVLELRAELAPLISKTESLAQDKSLVTWFMALLMRRMRAGSVRADVAVLAERVSAAFAGTVEGASLRASLPTLRRSAGLCPRCAQPYGGIEAACPECLASVLPAPPIELDEPALVRESEDDEVFEPDGGDSDRAAL